LTEKLGTLGFEEKCFAQILIFAKIKASFSVDIPTLLKTLLVEHCDELTSVVSCRMDPRLPFTMSNCGAISQLSEQ
jgi:hypothetical protein